MAFVGIVYLKTHCLLKLLSSLKEPDHDYLISIYADLSNEYEWNATELVNVHLWSSTSLRNLQFSNRSAPILYAQVCDLRNCSYL